MRRKAGLLKKILPAVLAIQMLAGCGLAPSEQGVPHLTAVKTSAASQASGAGQSLPTPAAAQTQAAPRPVTIPEAQYPLGALVVRRRLGTIGSLNPHRMTLSTEEEIAAYLFGSLYRMTADEARHQAVLEPYHAAGPPETTDGLSHTIRLRPGMVWSDGAPITAYDYEYAMERLLDPALDHAAAVRFTRDLPLSNAAAYHDGAAAEFGSVGFRALDERTLLVRLSLPLDPDAVGRGLQMPFLVRPDLYEAALAADPTAKTYGQPWQDLLFSGAYGLEEYRPGQEMRLKKRWDTGFDAVNSALYTPDFIQLRHIPSRLDALEAFLAGKLDVVPVSGMLLERYEEDPRLHLVPADTVWGIYVNADSQDAPLLADPDFRQALYLGSDRNEMTEAVFSGYRPYSGFVGPQARVSGASGETDYRKTRQGRALMPKADAYDRRKAGRAAEMALARRPGPHRIELIIPAQDLQLTDMADRLKGSWEELAGADRLTIIVTALPGDQLYERLAKGDYDLGFGGMGQDLTDPWRSLAPYTSDDPRKLDAMKSPAFDALWLDSTSGPSRSDPAQRLSALAQMEEILLAELPQIPLFAANTAYLVSDQLRLPFSEPLPGFGLGLDLVERRAE